MRNLAKWTALGLVGAAIATSPLSAATTKKPVPKKPTAKAPAKPSTNNKATAGTTQLKGSTPKFGETWTLGKTYPWNFKLNSAEYSVEQLKIGDTIYFPPAGQKLLVLHFTVHNPQPREALMRFDTFNWTVVDAKDTNWEGISELGSEKTRERVEMEMKPAQKMDLYTAVLVPAKAEMPKLIVKGSDDLVLRYDLRGKVKGMPGPFADPKDKTGATALDRVPAQKGTYYPLGQFDVKLDGVSTSDKKIINEEELEEGNSWVIVSMTAKNDSAEPKLLRFDTFEPKLLDQDGAEIEWNGNMLSGTRDKDIETSPEPGQELKFRYYFQIPSDVQLQSLTIREGGDGRTYVYDAEALK